MTLPRMAIFACILSVWELAQAGQPGLLISEVFPNPAGSDSPFEYIELVATKNIDFSQTPYSVVFVNNNSATANGWVEGQSVSYGFAITSGTVVIGEVVYVGGSQMSVTGKKLRVIDTGTTAGDGFGAANPTGVMGNAGNSADAVGVFDQSVTALTSTTAPIDALFYGSLMGAAVVSNGTAGYELPNNDTYPGGKLQDNSILAPDPGSGQSIIASGVFDALGGTFQTSRTWTPGTSTDSVSAVQVLSGPSFNLSTTQLNLVEGGAATSFTVVPTEAPTGTVTLDIAFDAAQVTVQPIQLVFSAADYTTPKSVTVSAINNGATDGPRTVQLTTTVSASGTNFVDSHVAQVSVQIQDDEDLGVTTAIHDIQGRAHRSPLEGQPVQKASGIVTYKKGNGFFMQSQTDDGDPATSEAIFVFTSSSPGVTVGDQVLVNGTVTEFRSNTNAANLTVTEITSPVVTIWSTGNALPAPVVIGAGGRAPPTQIIDDDSNGDVEAGQTFDPANDGIDFYESLEGMRVQVNNAVAVGAYDGSNVWVLADDGQGSSLRTPRGGIVIRPDDFNPERISLSGAGLTTVNLGDHFSGPIVGVLDYGASAYRLLKTDTVNVVHANLQPETSTLKSGSTRHLTVASFNVENLTPTDAPKMAGLADIIVNKLNSPDILGLEEVQDNSGTANNDGVVDADATLNALIAAISTAGGPAYGARQISPLMNADGGQPGGNIRNVLLFRADRVTFVDRAGGDAVTAVAVQNNAGKPQLSISPGRIDPTNSIYDGCRKALVGEFLFEGGRVFVIVNHIDPRLNDDPLYGRYQPPNLPSELKRTAQAQVVRDFIDKILQIDPDANVIALGDFNDFQFGEALVTLKGTKLNNLTETLPEEERYTYNYEGNAQSLDHIFVNARLPLSGVEVDIVHCNSEYLQQFSDHDPVLARLTLNAPRAGDLSIAVAQNTPQSAVAPAVSPIGAPLTYSVVAQPVRGTVDLNTSTGDFTYTPDLDEAGADSFAFKVFDGVLESNVALVQVTIVVGNRTPTANNQNVQVDEDASVSGQLAGSDPDGTPVTYALAAPPARGAVSVDATGAFTYTPDENVFGGDSFRFTVSDGELESLPATVTIAIAPKPDTPIADPAIFSNDTDTPVAGTLTAFDPDGDPVTFAIAAQPQNGAVELVVSTGAFTYTPQKYGRGVDTFTFTATDGTLTSTPAEITISYTNNHAPVAADSSVITNEDTPATSSLDATDSDDDLLVFQIIQQPAKGSVSILAGGSFTYTPATNSNGSDSFTYTAFDGFEISKTATVQIAINAVNDAPVVSANAFTTNQNTPLSAKLNATDAENDAFTFLITKSPTLGAITLDGATGNFTFTPNTDAFGNDTFNVKASDGVSDSAIVVMTVRIIALPAVSFNLSDADIFAGEAIRVDASSTTDLSGTALTYSWDFGDGTNGTGMQVIHLFANAGDYTVTLTVANGVGGSTTLTHTVHVNAPVNDPNNKLPRARTRITPMISTAPGNILFDAALSFDREGPLDAVLWQIGGNLAIDAQTTQTVGAEGVVPGSLQVFDSKGASATRNFSVYGVSGLIATQGAVGKPASGVMTLSSLKFIAVLNAGGADSFTLAVSNIQGLAGNNVAVVAGEKVWGRILNESGHSPLVLDSKLKAAQKVGSGGVTVAFSKKGMSLKVTKATLAEFIDYRATGDLSAASGRFTLPIEIYQSSGAQRKVVRFNVPVDFKYKTGKKESLSGALSKTLP